MQAPSAPKSPAPATAMRDFETRPLRIGILLWPAFPLMSLSGIVETLRHAGDTGDDSQQRFARWDILGAKGSRTLSSCGIPVDATSDYASPDRFDYLMVIGGLLKVLDQAPAAHRAYIRSAYRQGIPVVSACTGSFVLVQEGLLDGKPVGIHPYHQRDFEAAFPGHRMILTQDFVETGQVITVLGGNCILSFMAQLIGRHLGQDLLAKTVHQLTVPNRDSYTLLDQKALSPQLQIADPRVQRALVILEAQATLNPSIRELAQTLGMSERHLLRLFHQQVGRSPKDYLVDMKLRAAVWMLRHTSRSITSIAYAAGFSSGANLADHCRKRMQATPTQIRLAQNTA